MMDTTDIRIAALELVTEEILARLFHRDELADMARSLAPQAEAARTPDEQAVHLYAVGLVQTAMRREAPYSRGVTG